MPYTVKDSSGTALFIDAGTLTIDNTIGKRSQAAFTVHSTNTSRHYQQYEQISIYDSNNTLVFSGYITQPQEQKPGFQPSLDHKITCTDQHYLADKRIIARAYTNRTRSSIVADIVQTILSQEGVTVGAIYDEAGNVATLYPATNLFPNTTLFPQGTNTTTGMINATFNYCTVAAALDELTKDANVAGIPYYWSIDCNKVFWWVPYTYVVNNTVVDGTTIDQRGNPAIVTRQNPMYRNQQYIIGGTAQTATQTETKVGDGNSQSWTMGYELASAPTVSINLGNGSGGYLGWTTQTVGVKGTTGSQFYWAQGDAAITQDSSGTKLRGTVGATVYNDLLQVVYTGQYPTVVLANNSAQISYQAALDGTTGIIEEVEQVPTIQTLSDGLSKATGLLSRYGVQGIQLQFTQNGNAAGYAPGQLVTVNLPAHGLANTQMLIEETQATDQTDNFNIWYTIKAVVGPFDVTWIDFFGSVVQQQQPASSINVGASQTLVLLEQFSASLSLTATFTATVYACPIPSNSLFPSTSLFPC